ncbi:hypothetical protein ACRRTK_012119 [Alexandromys fortis]
MMEMVRFGYPEGSGEVSFMEYCPGHRVPAGVGGGADDLRVGIRMRLKSRCLRSPHGAGLRHHRACP